MKKNNPKVSIIIPVYNGSNYLNCSIESALSQTYKNVEILVVNDGSNDEGKTREIALSYKDKIKYIEKENGGVASALNTGIENATGEYISWLSHDDLYIPQKVEIEVNALNELENKQTVIFSNFDLINEKDKVIGKTNFLIDQTKEEFCQGFYPVVKASMNGCTTLINKKCFDEVGLFDLSLRTSQDYDMWLKLLKKFPSYFIEESLVKYRIHEKQDTKSNPVVEKESNEIWIKIISELNEEIIKSWNKETYNVYYDLYLQMKASKYKDACKLIEEKAKECYKKEKPYVSIIVPCYNSEKTLRETIDSLKTQTYANFEIILVDDASKDNTWNLIKELSKSDYRITYSKNKNKKGVSGALNTGISMAKGTLIARQDSDDIAHPDRIKEQVKIFKTNEKVGYCATNIDTISKDGKVLKNQLFKEPTAPIEFESAFLNPIPNATIIYKKELLDKYNLKFPEELKSGEDYTFLLNYIYKTKTKGYFINKSLYYYRILENSLYHSNVETSINIAYEKAQDYYYKILGKNNHNSYEIVSWIKPLKSKNHKETIKMYYDFSNKCREYFSWDENDMFKVIEYLLEYQNIHMKEMYQQNSLKSQVKNKLKEKGFLGTAKWGIRGILKKIRRIIKK